MGMQPLSPQGKNFISNSIKLQGNFGHTKSNFLYSVPYPNSAICPNGNLDFDVMISTLKRDG